MYNRKHIVDSFKLSNPSIAPFNAKMTEYRLVTAEFARIEPNVNAVFVSIGVKSVIDAVAPGRGQWLSAYDIALAEVLADEANKMDEDLTKYTTDMMKGKKERADLEFVFQVIETAANESGNVERTMDETEEKSRTLTIFGLSQPEKVPELMKTLCGRWKRD